MIKILGDKVALSPVFDPDTTPSGRIIIPDSTKERCDQGLVKYVGPEVKDIKPGDFCIFGNYDGQIYNIEDEGLLIVMSEASIKAIVGFEYDYFPSNDVPGLYFRDREGNYFTASYEIAHTLMATAIKEAEWRASWKIKTEKPKPEEYHAERH